MTSDGMIWLAYMAIPAALIYFVRHRRDVPFSWMFWMFGAFIIGCGVTHLMEVVTFFVPLYRLSGLVKLGTALVSWATVIGLVPLIPKAVALRSPEDLEKEIAEHTRTQEALRLAHDELERRVRERTAALAQANAALQAEVAVRRQAEESLRHSEERERARAAEFEAVLEATLAPIWIARDPECRRVTGNRASFELLRISRDSNATKTPAAGETPLQSCRIMKDGVEIPGPELPLQKAAARGEPVHHVEQDFVFGDGTVRHIYGNAAPLWGPDGKVRGAVAAFVDITERRQAEEALRASEERFRAFFELAAVGMAEIDLASGRYLVVNDKFCEITGYPGGELVQQTFLEITHPDDRAADLARFQGLVRGADTAFHAEKRYVRKTGETVWGEVNSTLIRGASGEPVCTAVVIQDVTARERAEEALRQAHDELEIRVRQRTSELAAANGALQAEIVERHRAEEQLRLFTAGLERSNRELQEFASVASHDLQEPLRKIQAFGDRLRARCGETLGDQGRMYLERMHQAAGRMSSLITDLLAFSRVTTRAQPLVPVDLGAVVREVLSDLEVRLQQSGGRVEVGALPTVHADPVQMRQLLQNLIGNALKFHRPGEPPVVTVQARRLQESGAGRGPLWQLAVADHGIGFDEKYLDRIFNVFQRLHGRDEYEGTGMGLAICRKIVERHAGTITAHSRRGHGATFLVTFPSCEPRGDPPCEQEARQA